MNGLDGVNSNLAILAILVECLYILKSYFRHDVYKAVMISHLRKLLNSVLILFLISIFHFNS